MGGLALALFGFIANNIIGATAGQAVINPHPYLVQACTKVKEGHQKAQTELAQGEEASAARKKLLTAALATETQGDIRAYLEREKAEEERLRAFERMFVTIIPWGWYALAQFLLVASLAFGVLLAIRLLSGQYQLAFLEQWAGASAKKPNPKVSPTLLSVLCLGILVGLAIHTVRSQFLVEKKTWLVWDSACMNAPAFFLGRLAVVGVGWVAMAFCALVWSAASKREVRINVTHADGACGQRRVMRFYKIWLRLPLLILMGGYYLFVAFAKQAIGSPGDDAGGYGLVAACLVLTWGVLAARIYLRVQETQEAFDKALAAEKNLKTTPADPTQEIFGGLWWEVPIGLATTLAAMYSLLHLETFLGR